MRLVSVFLFSVVLSVFLGANAFGADLKIKVVDPQGAAVAGARVLLLDVGRESALAAQTTSAEGVAVLRAEGDGPYRVRILAPGFAAESLNVSSQSELTVTLRLATASETVVVSATRTPVPEQAAGADVDSLNGVQLTTMLPVSGSDAVRFLPGAVVNTAGQRGGLSSLFVRGGESNYNKVIVDGVTVNEPGGTFDFGNLSLAQGDRMEFVRGAQSTLYGSDAMTSVVQVWDSRGQYERSGAAVWGGWRESGNGQRTCFSGRSARAIRLQLVWGSVQYERIWCERRLFKFSGRRERGSGAERFDFAPGAGAACQQSYGDPGRMEFQRVRTAGSGERGQRASGAAATRSDRMVAAEQSVGKR